MDMVSTLFIAGVWAIVIGTGGFHPLLKLFGGFPHLRALMAVYIFTGPPSFDSTNTPMVLNVPLSLKTTTSDIGMKVGFESVSRASIGQPLSSLVNRNLFIFGRSYHRSLGTRSPVTGDSIGVPGCPTGFGGGPL